MQVDGTVGVSLNAELGTNDGTTLGSIDGSPERSTVGVALGTELGALDGTLLGSIDGR